MKKLAIHGGKKLRVKPMPQREAFGSLEVKKLNEVVSYYRKKKSTHLIVESLKKNFVKNL